LRQAFAGLWNRLSILWKVVIALATLGSAVAFGLLPVVLFRAEPERKLHVGDTATLRLFDYNLQKIACHKHRKDLPKEIQERPFPFKGELCFAYFRIRNSSEDSRNTYDDPIFLDPSTGPHLHAGEKEYEATIATPMLPGTLVPDQEAPLTVIFDIPPRVEPTALTLKADQGEEEGGEVEWEIP
jgi:hypothetical protein